MHSIDQPGPRSIVFDTNTIQAHKPLTAGEIQQNLLTAMILREMTAGWGGSSHDE